jgi:hypothetical protein
MPPSMIYDPVVVHDPLSLKAAKSRAAVGLVLCGRLWFRIHA